MRGREFGLIGGCGILNFGRGFVHIGIGKFGVEFAGDACGIVRVWVGLALNPAL
jgi:hypothetical protein